MFQSSNALDPNLLTNFALENSRQILSIQIQYRQELRRAKLEMQNQVKCISVEMKHVCTVCNVKHQHGTPRRKRGENKKKIPKGIRTARKT